MPVLNTINAKIALAKGWKVDIFPAINLLTGERITKEGKPVQQCFWYSPSGQFYDEYPPDWVGTLTGVMELLWDLLPTWSLERTVNEWGLVDGTRLPR